MKRRDAMLVVLGTALTLLLPTVGRADIPGYTFSFPVSAKGALEGASLWQIGDVNTNGQFTTNLIADGEQMFVWDGSTLRTLSSATMQLPDGALFVTSNVWSPHGLNNNGVVTWVADSDGSMGPIRYVMTYDIASGAYAIIAKGGDPAPGGGTFTDQAAGPSNRMVADINDSGQVVWNVAIDEDGEQRTGIYMYDPATKETTAVVRPGTTIDGAAVTHAYWPSLNNAGQVVFTANLDDGESGIYLADKGNITKIAGPDTMVGDVTISAARWGDIAQNGDIVFVGDTADPQTGMAEVTDNTAVLLYSAADKSLKVILKPGDELPGGSTFRGVENSRRVVRVNNDIVAVVGMRDDDGTGIYVFDKATNTLQSLILGGTEVPGVGSVESVAKGVAGVTGYHLGLSDNGILVFPAMVAGVEGFIMAKPPTPPAAGG